MGMLGEYYKWRIQKADGKILDLQIENARIRNKLALVTKLKEERDKMIASMINGR